MATDGREAGAATSAIAERPQREGRGRRRGLGQAVARWALRTGPLRRVRLTRGDWGYLVGIFTLSRLLLFALGIIGSALLPEVGPHQTWVVQPITWASLGQWRRIYDHFDSGWYVGVSHGYPTVTPADPQALRIWGFMPGYPIALHLVALALGPLRVPGGADALAGVLVSHAALFGAVVYLYRLVAAELNEAAARRAVTYLLVFPTSIFLSAVYPEGLFLLATVGAFYHARRRQWALAGLLAAVATITHTEGPLILAPLTLEFLAYGWALGGWRRWLSAASLKLGWLLGPPLLTLGAYAAYSHTRTGYWLAFSTSQNLIWGHRLNPPIYPFIGFLLHPGIGAAFDFDFRLLNITVALLALALCVVAARRLLPAYALWILLGVLLPLSTDGSHTHSLARHVGALFAVFVALAAWSLRLRWSPHGPVSDTPAASPATLELRDRAALIPSALLMALFTLLFAAGVYAAI